MGVSNHPCMPLVWSTASNFAFVLHLEPFQCSREGPNEGLHMSILDTCTPLFETPDIRKPEYNGIIPKDEHFEGALPFKGGPVVDIVGNGLLVKQQYDIGDTQPGDAWLFEYTAFAGGAFFSLPGYLESIADEGGTSGIPSILDGSPVYLCFFGSESRDIAIGGTNEDVLLGAGGSDILIGLSGDDYIDGGSGGDIILGGAGLDILFGGSGNDT